MKLPGSNLKGIALGTLIGVTGTSLAMLGAGVLQRGATSAPNMAVAAAAGHYLADMNHRDQDLASASSTIAPKTQSVKWVCPMGHIVTDKPGTCPVCGMTLIKQVVGQSSSQGPSVLGTVTLSPQKQQIIGVRTAPAAYVNLEGTIRAAGKVDVDESRLFQVHTKIEGWIQDLLVNKTGQMVRAGQTLLTVYSPDLVSAQEEYLQAARTERELAKGSLLPQGAGLLAAARERLRNWDLEDADLARLRQTRRPQRAVALAAPRGGIVLEKKALAGMKVMPGDDLFTIADLSTVWVQAQVYESELPDVKVGERASVQLEALPGRTFHGRVAYLYPTLDGTTRTAKIRVELPNPDGALKPEMYAMVNLESAQKRRLAIPSEAVLDSGTRQVAFVAKPAGTFEPRVLQLGGYRGNWAIIRSGVAPGERVVTSANFLIDSESQLQAAMGAMENGHHHH